MCPDCGRPTWTGEAPPDEASCVHATDAFSTYDDDLLCAGLTITRLRAQLATETARVKRLEGRLALANVCWHCKVSLEPSERPRCDACPSECDDENCTEEGCADR